MIVFSKQKTFLICIRDKNYVILIFSVLYFVVFSIKKIYFHNPENYPLFLPDFI